MFLLDTNVVSEMRRKRPHQGVVQWLKSLDADQTVASAVTVGEIQYGIEAVREADVAKAIELETWLESDGSQVRPRASGRCASRGVGTTDLLSYRLVRLICIDLRRFTHQ